MYEQVAFRPRHKVRAFGESIDSALFDDGCMFAEGLVVAEEVVLNEG